MKRKLPSDQLQDIRPRTWIITGALVLATGTAAVLALANGPIANTELKPSPTPVSTTYPSPLPLTVDETGDQPTASPTPTPTETTAPAAPAPQVQQQPAAPVQQAPAAPAPHVPVKCPAGTVPGAVADNGDESNCAPPCQAYDDNNVCTSPGAYLGERFREEQSA